MPDNKELVPLNGKHLPYGFPEPIVQRALMYCLESKSVAIGHRRLKHELEGWGLPVPDYHSVWLWAKQSEECYQAVTGDRKREMIALASDAASAASERFLRALPGLSDSQLPVAYGIAMQRRTDWERAGQVGTVIPIQLNVSAGGQAEANPWSKDKD